MSTSLAPTLDGKTKKATKSASAPIPAKDLVDCLVGRLVRLSISTNTQPYAGLAQAGHLPRLELLDRIWLCTRQLCKGRRLWGGIEIIKETKIVKRDSLHSVSLIISRGLAPLSPSTLNTLSPHYVRKQCTKLNSLDLQHRSLITGPSVDILIPLIMQCFAQCKQRHRGNILQK
jgi:hypothetical protein